MRFLTPSAALARVRCSTRPAGAVSTSLRPCGRHPVLPRYPGDPCSVIAAPLSLGVFNLNLHLIRPSCEPVLSRPACQLRMRLFCRTPRGDGYGPMEALSMLGPPPRPPLPLG
ncbi:hypothetical protein GQ53DRAFT_497446 [Thozetella sp. PMI_491]|nr:hypothetical protein GQ53DRAFT_497446 [Thozetella sp. PMI_491]